MYGLRVTLIWELEQCNETFMLHTAIWNSLNMIRIEVQIQKNLLLEVFFDVSYTTYFNSILFDDVALSRFCQ